MKDYKLVSVDGREDPNLKANELSVIILKS